MENEEDDKPTATGAVLEAQAEIIDAAALAVETAQNAANNIAQEAAHSAAMTQIAAKEEISSIVEENIEAIEKQEDALTWVKTQAQVTAEEVSRMNSALTTQEQRLLTIETGLSKISEMLLSIQKLPEQENSPTIQPPPTPQSEGEAGPQSQGENQEKPAEVARKKRRWI